MACPSYFIVHSPSLHTRRSQCIQNLNGLSIVFYHLQPAHVTLAMYTSTTAQCGARSGSPQLYQYSLIEHSIVFVTAILESIMERIDPSMCEPVLTLINKLADVIGHRSMQVSLSYWCDKEKCRQMDTL